MRSMLKCAALSLALVAGCGTSGNDNGQASGQEQGGPASEPGGSGSGSGTAASCPLGAATFDAVLGLSNVNQQLSLAVDLNGNAFVGAGMIDASASVQAVLGMNALSAQGSLMFSLPAGSLVQTDAQGNIFVAGSFSTTIDLGAGPMVPNGNVDVFVAEFTAQGKLVFAKQLAQCGAGVEAMAIDKVSGRIAISGTAMGTVVLSARGDVMFTVQQSGFVAFDSKGNLVIGATLSAGVALGADLNAMGDTLTVMKIDLAGKVIATQSFQGTARINGVAIDASDNIVLLGATRGTIDFLGTSVTAKGSAEAGFTTGAFLVVLDQSCTQLVIVRDLGIVEANGLAIDANGNMFIAGAIAVNTGFFRDLAVLKIDTRGVITSVDCGTNVAGRALAIAVDACGGLYVAVVRQDTASAQGAIQAIVMKLAVL